MSDRPLNDYWVKRSSVNDCVTNAFNKIMMWQSDTDDMDPIKSAYGFLGNAIRLAQELEDSQ